MVIKSKRGRYGRQKKRRDESKSESETESYSTCDSDSSDDSSPTRSSSGQKSKKRCLSRKISPEELKEYMVKKAEKKALNAAKKLKAESFVWLKKIEKDIHHGASLDEFSMKAERRKHRERMSEAEKLKKKKEERAVEKALHEENMALLARERTQAEFQDLEKKEEEFVFEQSKLKSKMRLLQGRAKPIDVLYKHLIDGSDELSELYMVFKGLTLKDIEELHSDIKMYLNYDRADPTHVEYWEALTMLCDWELAKARKRDAFDQARDRTEEELLASQDRGLNTCVEADVRKLLDKKTHAELVRLQLEIESKLCSGSAKVVEYWEAVLKHIHIYKSKACLKEIDSKMLKKHLKQVSEDVQVNHVVEENEEIKGMNLSELFSVEDNLELKAMKVMGAMEEGDAVFGSNAEVNLDSEVYKPRKPKYFNRVHTGYEWNKYNQKHYDYDNPPPKFVQGYKFNIFYSDLLFKTKTPTCSVEKDGTSVETCIVRFHAGPPYEDIAFRIVNKEWEYSRKKSFKCTFESGILHLFFNFKRHCYRR